MTPLGKVVLIDDEPELRRAVERLLRAEGFDVESFGSAVDFLDSPSAADAGCLVLDVAMPGLDGLGLQQRLADRGATLPIVFLTGNGDIPMSVQAIKAGAVDFLTKPVRSAALLRAVRAALELATAQHAADHTAAQWRARLAQLTPREREVFEHVIAGQRNKLIADRLGTTEHTIKIHRSRVMEKMGVDSVAELVRAAQLLGVAPASAHPPAQ